VSRINVRSLFYNALLNLLLPGLGHLLWGEYLFGIFVFLVTLLSSVLFIVSLFLHLPPAVALALYALPLLFYAFTFVDLARTVKAKRDKALPGRKAAIIFLLVGTIYQLSSPIALVNFSLRNLPEIFLQEDNRLSPLYSEGDLLKASRLSYVVDVFVVNRPILHALPQRYDIVRFTDSYGRHINGIVVGLPGEEIEIADGVIVANSYPDIGDAPGGIILSGDWPLTSVGGYAILVATLSLGRIDEVHEVPLTDLVGKVNKLF
jgi:hypothetical protein